MRILSYDPETVPEGERIVVINGDNPLRFDSLEELKEPIVQNSQKLAQLESDIQGIEDNRRTIIDNTRRINNLEDRGLKEELLYSLAQASIIKTFVNSTRVEVQHNRKEIYVKKVMAYVGTAENEEMYEDITHSVKLLEVIARNPQGIIVSKKVIIQSENPITGYIMVV